MAILSKRIMADVSRASWQEWGLRPYFMDLGCRVLNGKDELSALKNTRRRRNYALQESINNGEPYVFQAAPGIATWVLGLEDRRMIHGGLLGSEVLIRKPARAKQESISYLVSQGMTSETAARLFRRLPVWPEERVRQCAADLKDSFYKISGWTPELMKENRLRAQQQEQINQAIEDHRKHGKPALYEFEKERVLLANIRAGDRNEARRMLNEMLGTIYMSSPRLVVLRARTVALMSCLTRAAIEDNPLMEPLIERNHTWTEKLIHAQSFEDLSFVLMQALDDFIDGIQLHGVNRSNTRVRMALDYISSNYMKKISLNTVADEIGLSPCRLSHLVKEFTGSTVLQIIQQVRVRQAQQMLARTSKSCTDIAYDVGFGDQSYFIKHFRRLTGTTPAKYRRVREE